MIKGILFDKDGTLLEFTSTMHHIYTDVIRCLQDRYQVPRPLVQTIKEKLGYLPDTLSPDSLLQFSTNPQIADAVMDLTARFQTRHHWQPTFTRKGLLLLMEERSLDPSVPYTPLPGVAKTLSYLKHKGYHLGIATADTRDATIAGLERTQLLSYFDYLGTGDDLRPKPDPFLAEHFCRHCGIDSHQLLIVGDSLNDMRFAENAGARFLGIDPAEADSPFAATKHDTTIQIHRMISIFNL